MHQPITSLVDVVRRAERPRNSDGAQLWDVQPSGPALGSTGGRMRKDFPLTSGTPR